MQELWSLHSACPLMLVDICMKFHDASLYGLRVIERTRWRQDFVSDKVQREMKKEAISNAYYIPPAGQQSIIKDLYQNAKSQRKNQKSKIL